jgi:preprotein translocase subunit SecA
VNLQKQSAKATVAAIYSGRMSHDQVLIAIGKGTVKHILDWRKNHNNEDPSFEYLMREYNEYPEFQKALLEKLKITREDVEKVVKGLLKDTVEVAAPVQIAKTGRNELCPCGSGKKYKKCCMK